VKITLTRSAIYATNLSRHPDLRINAVRKILPNVGSAAMLLGTKTGGKKQKWVAPVVVQRQDKESMVAEAKEMLASARESGDESLIEIAGQQLKAAESYTGQPSAQDEEAARMGKQRMDRMMSEAAKNASNALSPLPAYAAPAEEEKLVRKDVKRFAKNYETMVGDMATREAELREKYLKGRPSASQALAYETEMMKARQKFKDEFKAGASRRGLAAETASCDIGKSLKYRNLDYEILRAEKGTEYNFAKSPQGKEFLLVRVRVSNGTKADAYIDPDNAFGIIADGERVASRNYEIKTDIAPGGKNEGFVLFAVAQNASKFTLELGMKGEKKAAVDFKL
jgi:hypothetical protein